jgi:two-component system, OmpR family, phosphate regulon sensor histidine kinase PhoR
VRLTRRLLLGSLLLVGVLVLLVVMIVDNRLHGALEAETRERLEREAALIHALWRAGGSPAEIAPTVGHALGMRVTLIDRNGFVVGDSELESATIASAPHERFSSDVAEATARGVSRQGQLRESGTEGPVRVTVREDERFVRIALLPAHTGDIARRTGREVLVAGILVLMVALILAWLFARSVARPIVELRDVARGLADGDLTLRPALSAPGEVGDLSRALHTLAEQLGARLGALQSEDALLLALIESLHEGVLAVDARRMVVRINRAGRVLLGVGAPVPFSTDLLPRQPELRQALSEALAGRTSHPVEVDFDNRVLALTARPLQGGGAVVALFDFTQIRRLEAVRRDFVANVSHELRTPLTIIGGFAETLSDRELPTSQRIQFAELISANTGRMQRIVDDLLDLSRIESGGWTPAPTMLELDSALRDVLGPLQEIAQRKSIALVQSVAPDARVVYADPTAFRQVLANLVENALRHTASGKVEVESRAGDGGVWLAVRDTGSGIPAEHLPRVFERFYRVDPGRSREQGGTGLGLSIVRHLVESHGGRAQAASTLGKGTSMEVFFPGPLERP